MDQTTPFNHWKVTVEHAKRGKVVTGKVIEDFGKQTISKPYGSSSFGYEFNGPTHYNNGRGARGNFRGSYRGSDSFNHRDSGPPGRGRGDFYMRR